MTDHQEHPPDVRLARILLPAGLLREVDELILSGRGGYSSRQEFFRDAIENHALEVRHGSTEHGQLLLDAELDTPADAGAPARTTGIGGNGRSPGSSGPEDRVPMPAALSNGTSIEPISDIKQTALIAPARGVVVEHGIARSKKEPLIGLHNRDYPSLWAACLLADLSEQELPRAPQFVDEATRQAWRYAQSLLELEQRTKTKLTALFPTNISKPQSAEEGFRAFAIGAIARKPAVDGRVDTSGPLFSWQVAQLVRSEGTITVGLTDVGWQLVEALDGLTLAWPHEQEYAERFFDHLRRHARWDWEGFEQVIAAAASSPTRAELAAAFQSWQPEWSETVVNTTSAGYVARAREWGLIEPKLVDGRYVLTAFGEATQKERSPA